LVRRVAAAYRVRMRNSVSGSRKVSVLSFIPSCNVLQDALP
jgi:hypothetical protein